MNLADKEKWEDVVGLAKKPCYPNNGYENKDSGLTLKERLVIALASNPKMMVDDRQNDMPFVDVALCILEQADAIINQLTKE